MNRLIDKLRARHKHLDKASLDGAPLSCIRLFCLECMGGSAKEVAVCSAPKCPLYPLRFGKRPSTVERHLEAGKQKDWSGGVS